MPFKLEILIFVVAVLVILVRPVWRAIIFDAFKHPSKKSQVTRDRNGHVQTTPVQ